MDDDVGEVLSNGHVPTYVPSTPPTPPSPPPAAAANGRPRQAWAGEGGCPGRCARCLCAPWRALCLKCQSCCARCKCAKCCQPKPEKAPEDTPGCCGGRSKCCAKVLACCGGSKGDKGDKGDKGGCCTRISPCCASPRCFKLSPCFARLACCRPKKAAPATPAAGPAKGDAEGGEAADGDAEAAPVSRWRRLLRRLDCRRVLRACCGSCCNCEGSLKSARCTCTMDCRAFFCGPIDRCRERCQRRKRQPTIASKKSTSMEEGSFMDSDGLSTSADDDPGF